MRLSELQHRAIMQELGQLFGTAVTGHLFGSRVDDKLKGGDIDLHLEFSEAVPELWWAVLRLNGAIQRRLGAEDRYHHSSTGGRKCVR